MNRLYLMSYFFFFEKIVRGASGCWGERTSASCRQLQTCLEFSFITGDEFLTVGAIARVTGRGTVAEPLGPKGRSCEPI